MNRIIEKADKIATLANEAKELLEGHDEYFLEYTNFCQIQKKCQTMADFLKRDTTNRKPKEQLYELQISLKKVD